MKNSQYELHQKATKGSRWLKHLYGKRHLAFQLLIRRERLRNRMRIAVAGAAVVAMLASFYE